MLIEPSACRVLIVEEEPLLRWALSETLRASGITVLVASDPEAGIRAAVGAPGSPDVVLLDYGSSNSRGAGLLRTLATRRPGMPVIAMSAFWSPELVAQAYAAGARRVVQKPLEMHEVPDLIRGVARKAPEPEPAVRQAS